VLQDLAREFPVSLDALVLGRNTQELPVDNPLLTRMIRFLVEQDAEELLRLEGALRMYQAMPLTGKSLRTEGELVLDGPEKMESLTEMLVQLAGHIQTSQMSLEDKETSKEMLNRLVLSIYQRDMAVHDDWAELEEIE
jgi:hypothetical protein